MDIEQKRPFVGHQNPVRDEQAIRQGKNDRLDPSQRLDKAAQSTRYTTRPTASVVSVSWIRRTDQFRGPVGGAPVTEVCLAEAARSPEEQERT